MMRIAVKPELLRWARVRAGHSVGALRGRFPKVEAWERNKETPTLKQLEAFAKANFVPVGYLFLPEPPVERIPIPDLRTVGGRGVTGPGANLLDTLYLCQRRQAWYRDFAISDGEDPKAFVRSETVASPVKETAARIRHMLRLDLEERRKCPTWTDALRQFIQQAEELGVLVMVSGVVGSNNRRKLDPRDFRGFALADEFAPLVFVNGADTKAAQMFTLAHELAHLWLGESALSDATPTATPQANVEHWCNAVAAELLVPLDALRSSPATADPLAAVPELTRQFKVSPLVILRRLLDAGRLSHRAFQHAYGQELERLAKRPKSAGGDFYLTQEARSSRRFVRALVASTLEGRTLFREAFQLLGVRKEKTLFELGRNLGIAV
jgi:Zn-dependent peptidase ImmA (M78 family)